MSQHNNKHCFGVDGSALRKDVRRTSWLASLLALAACLLFTSCEKEIEFNGEQSDPKLVINSLVEPGQPVKAAIGKSYFFLDPPDTTAPDDLEAALYVNGNLVGTMTPGYDTIWYYDGLPDYTLCPSYFSDYCPQEGDVVTISATANGFDEAEGSTSQLPKMVDCGMEVAVSQWDMEYWYEYNYYEGVEYCDTVCCIVAGSLDVTLTITDPNPGKTDCFRLIEGKNNVQRVGLNSCYFNFDYDDPIFETGITSSDLFDLSDIDTRPVGVFTDMLFDGGSYRLKVKVDFYCMIYDEDFDPDYFRAIFQLEHLSKEYYNYLSTCDQGELALQIFSEPIQTYNNVNNGFGIVGGRAVNRLCVDLPLEEP